MADPFDPFGGETGLLDDYDGVIVDSFFATDPERPAQGYYLNLTCKTDDEDTPEVTNRYRLGPDWTSYDGGKTVTHPKWKKFQNNTQYYELVVSAFQAGAEEVLRERGGKKQTDDGQPLGPRDASIWMGLKFHWNLVSKSYNFKDKEGNEVKGTTSRPLPSKFEGEYEVSEEGGNEWEDPTVNVTPLNGAVPAGDDEEAIPESLLKQLRPLAKTHPFEDFIDKALPIVAEDGSINPAILGDEAFYASLKG